MSVFSSNSEFEGVNLLFPITAAVTCPVCQGYIDDEAVSIIVTPCKHAHPHCFYKHVMTNFRTNSNPDVPCPVCPCELSDNCIEEFASLCIGRSKCDPRHIIRQGRGRPSTTAGFINEPF